MKILHISDLHIGKRVHGFSMIEDQKYILNQILDIIDEKQIGLVMMAGDIYDQSIPCEQAVVLFDWFINELVMRKVKSCIISGNHDSNIRLGFGAKVFESQGVYIESGYHGQIECVKEGNVCIHMIPFVKPAMVQPFFKEQKVDSYQKAMECLLSNVELEDGYIHIAMVHQFIVGAKTCESEEVSVGGLDQISADVFADFDYVALGHLHSFQHMGKNGWYCGTMLKYSVDEIQQQKKVIVLDVSDHIEMEEVSLHPMRDLVEIRGDYMELTNRMFYEDLNKDDYYSVVLTDENDVPNAFVKLQMIYPNIMKLAYDNQRTKEQKTLERISGIEEKNPLDLIEEFYKLQNNADMNEEQKKMAELLWEEVR